MRRSLLRYFAGALVITLATAGAVAASSLLFVQDIVGHGPRIPNPGTPAQSGEPQTLLLVGSDHRFGHAGDDARSDTMMLVRIDPHADGISVLSIPRDLRVRIPGHGVDKINAAYSEGGLKLVTRTVQGLLSTPSRPFAINHVVGVNFDGFAQAIDRIGCVYVDVDRRYYHSNAGLPASEQYAEIDLQPGYQRLCGKNALDFARFRHLDNDLVRAARQQALLRDVRDQLGSSGQLGDVKPLARIASRSTVTDADLRTTAGALRLLKLVQGQAGHPVRQLAFPAQLGESDVTVTRTDLRKVTDAFLGEQKPAAPKPKTRHHRSAKPAAPALDTFAPPATAIVPFPVYLPTRLAPGSSVPDAPRPYATRTPDGHIAHAYRLVVDLNPALGQYYGVQGTTWADPPVLHGATPKRDHGRTYLLVRNGSRLQTVGWHTRQGTYWVSNTLTGTLSDGQMLGIARSLRRF
jgi:polyisoprenyl-teichoic acid--peptidoglycan teichoic acid transferase